MRRSLPCTRSSIALEIVDRAILSGRRSEGVWPGTAGAGAAKPSSRQLTDWFWNETATGAAIHVLREVLQAHEDERLRLIVSNFVVPAGRHPSDFVSVSDRLGSIRRVGLQNN
jgi:hypothetical protein